MYGIDPKFFNPDGSLNTDAACAAGRKEQARVAGEGARELKVAAARLASKLHDQFAILLAPARQLGRNSSE